MGEVVTAHERRSHRLLRPFLHLRPRATLVCSGGTNGALTTTTNHQKAQDTARND